jgi:hypothetical protein
VAQKNSLYINFQTDQGESIFFSFSPKVKVSSGNIIAQESRITFWIKSFLMNIKTYLNTEITDMRRSPQRFEQRDGLPEQQNTKK